MNPLNTLSRLIEEALDQSGLSEREVEALTGINRNTLKRRLVKPGDLSLDETDRIARFMGTTAEALIAKAHGRAA